MNGILMRVLVGIIVSITAGENVLLDHIYINTAYSIKIKGGHFKRYMGA
jgi:hypothetical protein